MWYNLAMVEISVLENRLATFSKVLNKIPEVKYIGDSILRTKTEEITLEEGIEIGKKLGEVLLKYRNIAGYGRGFAAPQIGIGKSVFTTFINDEIQIFINPRIINTSETKNYYKELCLSSGIISADVARPDWIEMEWMDTEGKIHKEKFEGFLARLYQHEEGHLRGIVNVDICEKDGLEICTFDPLKETLRPSR